MPRLTFFIATLLALLLAVGCSAPEPTPYTAATASAQAATADAQAATADARAATAEARAATASAVRPTGTAMAASTATAAHVTVTAAAATSTAVTSDYLKARSAARNLSWRLSTAEVTATITAATAIAPHHIETRATAIAARATALAAVPRPPVRQRENPDARSERIIGQALVRLGRSGHSGTEEWDAHTCGLLSSADSRGFTEVWNTASGQVRFGTLDQYLQATVREGPRDWESELVFALLLDHC